MGPWKIEKRNNGETTILLSKWRETTPCLGSKRTEDHDQQAMKNFVP